MKHGKQDERETNRARVDKMLKSMSRQKPMGNAHRELIRRDVEKFQRGKFGK